jgi:hypothetical protein
MVARITAVRGKRMETVFNKRIALSEKQFSQL